jgi:hypothetical protein
MAFNWIEYLEISRSLLGLEAHHSEEAAHRSAVSRAYYAAYCYARNHARDREGLILTNRPSDHGLVRRHHLKKGRVDLASELDDLRQWRNSCDYEDELEGNPKLLVAMAVQSAKDIMDSINFK